MAAVAKINDIAAHIGSTLCLRIGPKSGRVMVTGGEDKKINLWAIGKTTPLLSLSGHSTDITAVTLDWPEEIVVAGASSGTIKLWDLQHAKVIRTLPGHKKACTSVEFHPFGEFFASGSADLTVKVWDIRRKGCIQTYQGHAAAVSVLKITPDGRWIASGSADGTVKIWDMTAGKLIHSFNETKSGIMSMAFSPAELVLATISSNGMSNCFDLQSFECISSCQSISSSNRVDDQQDEGRCIEFHPDGAALALATSHSLQIWSWEPPECHSNVPAQWGRVVDMKVLPDENKLVAASIDQNFVHLWGANLTKMSPFIEESEDIETRETDSKSHTTAALMDDRNSSPERSSSPLQSRVMEGRKPPDSLASYFDKASNKPTTSKESNIRSGRADATDPSIRQSRSNRAVDVADSKPSRNETAEPNMPTRSSRAVEDQRDIRESRSNRIDHIDFRDNWDSPTGRSTDIPSSDNFTDANSQSKSIDNTTSQRAPSPEYTDKRSTTTIPAQEYGRNYPSRDTRDERPIRPQQQQRETAVAPVGKRADESKSTAFTYPHLPETRKAARQDWQPQVHQPVYDLKNDEAGAVAGRGSSTSRSNTDSDNSRPNVIPASGERPLGLDISKFGQAPENDLPSLSSELSPSLTDHHASVVKALSTRLTALRAVRAAWTSSGLRGAMDACLAFQDFSVWVDFLKVLATKPKLLTLDSCSLFLPVLDELLFAVYEEYVVVACSTIRILARHFGSVIVETLESSKQYGSSGIDITREERIEKCRACHRGFLTVARTLNDLRRSTGSVGTAVRDAIRELETLSFSN
ncbi:hypothetical protein SmJEL517_g05499 [Synchytrium microbalum]|uniref:Katanin p80 WD40 repeat-containing subunit B1 homolog n=1 Tax=Synchytrium microbalum TaxID=1806994 RepID=A0A507BU14_9FUNG|nr:uncharacterized protein SmJEL517_g05499 [Synchytrium microbalum]TPX31072.1 hypothetical protein SmJEL517_g05499 [Synchytrium microbalum]